MNKNIYKIVGKKIYEKEDGKRYGMLYLVYPLVDGDGYAFTNYSAAYISQKRVDAGVMNEYNIGDTVVVTYGYEEGTKKKYIKSATVLTPDVFAELEYLNLED